MTDDTPSPDETPTPAARALDWIVDVEERLLALEARTPADDVDADPEAQRLDRHRAELEAIKRTINRLIDYVVKRGATEAPQQLQPAPTTSKEYL